MKTVLNVGAGVCPIHPQYAGWKEIRLDIDKDVRPDIVGDIRDMYQVLSESVDSVYSNHNLEHLISQHVPLALAEFYRVLKPGGLVCIGVPNLQEIAIEVSQGNLEGVLYESPAGPIAAIDCIYGYRKFIKDNPLQAHKTGFTPATLEREMKKAGFTKINLEFHNVNMWATGVKE
jgi:ubiquinone/menaquinone biosynthesis C-methylase UbiE